MKRVEANAALRAALVAHDVKVQAIVEAINGTSVGTMEPRAIMALVKRIENGEFDKEGTSK